VVPDGPAENEVGPVEQEDHSEGRQDLPPEERVGGVHETDYPGLDSRSIGVGPSPKIAIVFPPHEVLEAYRTAVGQRSQTSPARRGRLEDRRHLGLRIMDAAPFGSYF